MGINRRVLIATIAFPLAGCTGSDDPDGDVEGDKDDDPDESEPDDDPEETEPEAESDEPKSIRIGVYDVTDVNPPADTEIWVEGEGSWYPDFYAGGDVLEDAGAFEGESGEFFIYPDGRDNIEIQVELVFPENYIGDSPRDSITVDIKDSEVIVYGRPVVDGEQVYDR